MCRCFLDRTRADPLNEVADRLAVAARRCHDANVSPEVASTIANNIVASLKNPLPETA
ncbi:hypothetical protein Y013_13275 [Rhodococcus pyridinivorans SB3094]|uniref:Uncharacterized protein n=1 Tax=Rhodococcus pyridinivorans SB3094 TaxID=1435356 RepID=V9XP19_9NOCA|nr:hypothetical protein Y013_13275 [Rhodococcus pyridinivorans SB3094]